MPFLNLETEQRQKLFEVELVIDGQPGSMKIDTGASAAFKLLRNIIAPAKSDEKG